MKLPRNKDAGHEGAGQTAVASADQNDFDAFADALHPAGTTVGFLAPEDEARIRKDDAGVIWLGKK
jgi:hypothetical protein